jgi:hypothetical protein
MDEQKLNVYGSLWAVAAAMPPKAPIAIPALVGFNIESLRRAAKNNEARAAKFSGRATDELLHKRF